MPDRTRSPERRPLAKETTTGRNPRQCPLLNGAGPGADLRPSADSEELRPLGIEASGQQEFLHWRCPSTGSRSRVVRTANVPADELDSCPPAIGLFAVQSEDSDRHCHGILRCMRPCPARYLCRFGPRYAAGCTVVLVNSPPVGQSAFPASIWLEQSSCSTLPHVSGLHWRTRRRQAAPEASRDQQELAHRLTAG